VQTNYKFSGYCDTDWSREMKKLKIYMDNCCFNRPFDDCSSDRVFLESEAILTILRKCQEGIFEIIGSDVLDFEMSNMSNIDKKNKVISLYSIVKTKYTEDEKSKKMSEELIRKNVKWLDSMHVSIAEVNKVDIFLTTDDKLMSNSNKVKLKMRVINPLNWIVEVMNYE
jgi:hypothetical protein